MSSRDGAEDYTAAARRPVWLPREAASAIADLDMKKDVDDNDRIIIPCPEKLMQVIDASESKLPPYRRCTTSADEERYDLGGQVEARMKTVVCKHFCDDEVCMHVRPPSRRVFSGHAEGCSFSHHPSRFQQVPSWCMDDPGFICWCLKHLPPERQVVHEILGRLIDQFERLQDCPICFIKHPLVSLHREGDPAQLNHVACANCTKQLLEQDSPTCPVCRKEISSAECRSIMEGIKDSGWVAWWDVANEVYNQLGGSNQDKEPVLGSNWDTDSDFAEQQESSETAVEDQVDIDKGDVLQNFEDSRHQPHQEEVSEQSFGREEDAFRGSGEDYSAVHQAQGNVDVAENLHEDHTLHDWDSPLREQVEDLVGSCGELNTATCQASQPGAALSESLSTSASEVYSTAPSADFGMPSLASPAPQATSINGLSLLPPVGAPPPPPRGPPPNVRPPPASCLAVRAQVDSFFSSAAGPSFPPPTSSSMASMDRPPLSSVADVDIQAEFRCWLQDQQLGEYEVPLREKGADRLEIMKYVLDADLMNLGMPLLHRRALLNASDATHIATWRASRNSSQL